MIRQYHTHTEEIICCDCGDDPDLDYCDVSMKFQRIREPYPIAAGDDAYEKHVRYHQQQSEPRR